MQCGQTSVVSALILCLLFASLLHKVVQPLYIERPAFKSSKVIELDDKENAPRRPMTSADAWLFLEHF